MDTPIKSLSGGNQQKVILARWLLTNPQYLILDEPTRGIDVGTKVEIQKLILKLAEDGVSITFISSEIEEMLRTCSRLIVMRDRKVVGQLKGEDMTQDNIMHMIAGRRYKMGNGLKKFTRSQLVIPLFSLLLLVVFNLIRDVEFFCKHCNKQPGEPCSFGESDQHFKRCVSSCYYINRHDADNIIV